MKKWLWPVICAALCLLLACPCLAEESEAVLGEVDDLLQGVNAPGSEIAGTPLGYAAADAVHAALGTDLAVVNGGDIAHNLQGGEASWTDVVEVFREDKPLGIAEITAAQLKDILEIAVSTIVVGEDDKILTEESRNPGFIQPSGFVYQCDGSAPVGERIRKVWLDNGSELDLSDDVTIYTLAATESMLSGDYGFPRLSYTDTEYTLASALGEAITAGTLTYAGGDRVQLVGTGDNTLLSYVPIGLLILAGLLVAETNYKKNTRLDHTRYNYRVEAGYERKKYIRN